MKNKFYICYYNLHCITSNGGMCQQSRDKIHINYERKLGNITNFIITLETK